MVPERERAGDASKSQSVGADSDLKQIGYVTHLRTAFKISPLSDVGIPFEDEPNLEARIEAQDANGCEIRLHDKSEKQPPVEGPRLKVDFMSKESGVGVLALSVVQDIPEDHLLMRNMFRIRGFLKELSPKLRVSFSDRAVGGMSHEKSSQLIRQSFTEAAQEALKDKFKPLDENLLTQHSKQIGLGGVKTFREFRGLALRFMIGTGLQANIMEKINVMCVWSQKLAEKGVLPSSAVYAQK